MISDAEASLSIQFPFISGMYEEYNMFDLIHFSLTTNHLGT